MTHTHRTHGRLLAVAAVLLLAWAALSAAASVDRLRPAVIKIYVTIQGEDYTMPWQGGRSASGTGTGFVIGKRRILTNAHVVSNARFIEVQKDGLPGRAQATVEFVAHDCDLATLIVSDPAFLDGVHPLQLARRLPDLNEDVMVLGYPTGGNRMSVTRGVVSRIDYSAYSHSAVDHHLVLQVDAAINPGNSGGPILLGNRVVALAFQGLAWADNIGYGIPLPVVRHFLDDIADGRYDGYPELGVSFLPTRNPALRADLKLPYGRTGVAVHFVDPFGSARDLIRDRDVLTAVDGLPIADDGTINIGSENVVFGELIERKQFGQAVTLGVWREGQALDIRVPLTNPADPFTYRNEYDVRPEYLAAAGLVFSPLTRELLKTAEPRLSDPDAHQLFYASQYAKVDGLYRDREQFVVLIRRLPHPVNSYMEPFVDGIVAEANGKPIASLRDLRAALATSKNGYHVIRFEGRPDALVLDASAALAADAEIRERYELPAMEYFRGKGEQP